MTAPASPLFSARETGSVLLVSLMILLVMTILGLSSMSNTGMEEKMSGNQRDTNVAFYAAEASLRDGEAFVESLVTTGGFTGANGQLAETDDEPDYWDETSWDVTSSRAYSGTVNGVHSQPRYIVQLMGDMSEDTTKGASIGLGGYGDQGGGQGPVTAFRVTARGTGGSDNTQTVVQSYYGKQF